MKQLKNYQGMESGRSMVELLGVLAVIGVLSVGGLTGYNYVMKRQRITETINQVAVAMQSARGLALEKISADELTTVTDSAGDVVGQCLPIRYVMPRATICPDNPMAFQTAIGACVSVCRDASNIWQMNVVFDENNPDSIITRSDCRNILDSAVAQDGFLNLVGDKATKKDQSDVQDVCDLFQ